MTLWKDYLDKNKEKFLNELLELLRIPSVSARTEHKNDMVKTAEAVKQRLIEAGVDKAEIYSTEGHPVVYAEKIIDKDKPTVFLCRGLFCIHLYRMVLLQVTFFQLSVR